MPQSPIGVLLGWIEAHANLWEVAPTSLGLTAARVTGLQDLHLAAVKEVATATAARIASKNATNQQNLAIRNLRDECADMIQVIKGFIESSGNEALWNLAGLTPNAGPGEAVPPNSPTNIVATLDLAGKLTLSWKASQPGPGTVYRIYRAFNGSPTYTLLDAVGEKYFVDETIPFGTRAVAYEIVARRVGLSAPTAVLLVQFGSIAGPGGGLTIVSETFNGKPVNFQQASAA